MTNLTILPADLAATSAPGGICQLGVDLGEAVAHHLENQRVGQRPRWVKAQHAVGDLEAREAVPMEAQSIADHHIERYMAPCRAKARDCLAPVLQRRHAGSDSFHRVRDGLTKERPQPYERPALRIRQGGKVGIDQRRRSGGHRAPADR
ncbi:MULTISPECIES: hypothetical protein [Methylococcus]|uniref:Uncharacterized protein n=1 Tax=Methylococcus capsulatus TaxID=414 RepID=A0ABZ2F6G6_METCP|nr:MULTISPECIES: hypothetical protein [Methylococcus]MDF9392986.1 hypothetical protein [Methylococcus capsulatus]